MKSNLNKLTREIRSIFIHVLEATVYYSIFNLLYSMKIKEQTRKLAVGCSKHCFEVVDKTDEVSHIYNPR